MFDADPYAVLGLAAGASQADVKAAYRRRAKEEHPDLFAPAERPRQQLRMMELNEAYMQLLADAQDAAADPDSGSSGHVDPARRSAAPYPGLRVRRGGGRGDPSYDLYRQGYEYLGRARALMNPRRNLDEDELKRMKLRSALEALRLTRHAYRYFLNVITGYPTSPWADDALEQMEHIESISKIYQRMCEGSLAD